MSQNASQNHALGVVQFWLHLKHHVLRSYIRVVHHASLQMLAVHLESVRVHAVGRGCEHIPMAEWAKPQDCLITSLVPLVRELLNGRGIRLWCKNRGLLRWWLLLAIRWGHLVVIEVHCRDIMNASSPFVLPPGELPDEVFLRMTSNLCWSSCDHKIPRYVSPIPFSILL